MARRGGNQSREHAARARAIRDVLEVVYDAIVVETDAGILKKHGIHNRSTGIPKSWVDMVAFLHGRRTLCIEVKTGDADLVKGQEDMREQIEKRGHEYVLARNVDDVIAAVEVGKETKGTR